MKFFSLLIALSLIFSKQSLADNYVKKLTVDDVVESASQHYPTIFSHYDKVKAKESSVLASKGFFDVKLKQSYQDRTRGYYDGKLYNVQLEKELGIFNSKVYTGYRKSYGDFPDYEGGFNTNDGGEYRAGAKFSLLKDRSIDENRLRVILANLSVKEAKIELETIKKEITRDAKKAYWIWVTDGKIYEIYKDLYELSYKRQKQLDERVKHGDLAEIIAVENRRNILRRKNALAKIKQEFENSAIYLSLFYRDERGNPVIPKYENLPEINSETHILAEAKTEEDIITALRDRPEARIIKIQRDEVNNRLKYAENLLQPQLDVEIGVSNDVGNGSQTRDESNNYAQLDLSVPLQMREARGKIAESEANLSAIRNEQRILEEQITANIKQIRNKIETIHDVYLNLLQEVELNNSIQRAENEKFKRGASDMFLLNSREQDYAASRAAVMEIYRDYQEALADYDFAIFK